MASDVKLLDRWTAARDAQAFNELVSRYADFVYATCHRILRNRADAEDVTQECFFGLSRVDARVPTSLGGWLHTVATRRSINQLKKDARRRQREQDYGGRRVASEPRDDTWEDVKEYVDEAIEELPERLRDVIVGHFLERESHRVIARRHGVSRRTVTNWANKGVHSIRQSLRRRGVTVAAAALSSMLAGRTAQAAPTSLVAGLGKIAVAGAATSPGRVAQAPASTFTPAGLKTLSVAALAVAVIGSLVYLSATSGRERDEPSRPVAEDSPEGDGVRPPLAVAASAIDQEEPAVVDSGPSAIESDASPVEDGFFRVSGRVVTESGDAVAGAKIVLFHDARDWGLSDEIVEDTTSDADGSYAFATAVSFEKPSDHAYARDFYVVLATHPEYAFGWKNVRRGDENSDHILVMTPPTSRTIVVVDGEGQAIAGARVWLYSAGARDDPNPLFRDHFSTHSDIGLVGDRTGLGGIAVVKHLPDTSTSLRAWAEGYAEGLCFSSGTRIILTRGATLQGRVVSESGEPVDGVKVTLAATWMNDYLNQITDAAGGFVFEDVAARGWDMSPWGEGKKGNGQYDIRITSDRYTSAEKKLVLEPGDETEIRIKALRGTPVKCLVVDAETKKPVSGARVGGSSASGRLGGFTNSEGILKVTVVNGPVSLFFHSPPDGVYTSETNAPRDARSTARFEARGEEVTITLVAPPIVGRLIPVRGRVANLAEAEDSRVVVYASAGKFNTATKRSYIPQAAVDADGTFTFKEVPAGRVLRVFAVSDDRQWAGTATRQIPAVEVGEGQETPVGDQRAGELVVPLVRTLRVQRPLHRADGSTLASVQVNIRPIVDGEVFGFAERTAKTDENGLLDFDGVLPGLEYQIRERSGDASRRRPTLRVVPFTVVLSE